MNSISFAYESIWRNLTADLGQFRKQLKDYFQDYPDQKYHDSIKEIYHYPKTVMSEYLVGLLRDVEGNPPNPGSITGLFFEELIAAFLDMKKPNGVDLYRNYMPDNDGSSQIKTIMGIRDPDIYLCHQDFHYIIETKFVVNSNFIETFRNIQDAISTSSDGLNIKYRLIVGWSSIRHNLLEEISHTDWICVIDGSPGALAILESPGVNTFDQMLDEMVRFFNNS